MAQASINFQKTKRNSVAETTRQFEANYLLPKEHRKENEYWDCGTDEHKLFMIELEKAGRLGGPKPKFENSIWEAVLNLNEEHTMQDVKKIAKHIEEKFNIRSTRIAIHRDEGHYNLVTGKVEYNFHAHLNFMTYQDGKQNWRRELIKKTDLSNLQTEVSDILKMERGEKGSNSIRANHRHFRENAVAIKEQRASKKQNLATQNDLKNEIENLKKQLKESGAKREDYAKIEQISRELKEQIKAKILTVEELKNEIAKAQKSLAATVVILDKSATPQGSEKVIEIARTRADEAEIERIKNIWKDVPSVRDEVQKLKKEIIALQKDLTKSTETALEAQKTIKEYKETIKERSSEIEQVSNLYGQLVGSIELGINVETLRELVKAHKPCEPKNTAYITAKERAKEAYKARIRPSQEEPKRKDQIVQEPFKHLKNDSSSLFAKNLGKGR